MEKFNINTKTKDIPDAALNFNMGGECTAFGESEDEKNHIRLILYDGSIQKHWYWGNLAFDLAGIKLAKKRIPILDEHDVHQILGFSTSASFAGKFVLEGVLLSSSERAQQRKRELAEGFPFEASMRFNPTKSKIEYIKEGQSTKVNGHVLNGPGTIIKPVVIEGSMCVFGALSNCRSEAFNIRDGKSSKSATRERADFWDQVEQYIKDEECSKADAVRFCVEEYPKLHKQMLENMSYGHVTAADLNAALDPDQRSQ